MIWLILLVFFLLLILALLFAPLKVKIDSENSVYAVSYAWFLKGTASLIEDDIALKLSILGLSKNTTLLQLATKEKRKKSITKRVTDSVVKRSKKRRVSRKMIFRIIKSFHVKRFFVDIDLGSVYYNAWIYPLGKIFRTKKVHFTTNFIGNTVVDIEIINRPSRLLWVVVKYKLNNKKK